MGVNSGAVAAPLPDFDQPPVVEAVLGLEFGALPVGFMGLARFHDLWASTYPETQEMDALVPTQPVGQPMGAFQFQLATSAVPMRLWSMTSDRHWLVQSQADRLIVNWRQLETDQSYPHFEEMQRRFDVVLTALADHVTGVGLGGIEPLVVEYTYVNRLPGEFDRPEYVYSIFSEPLEPLPGEAILTRFHTVRNVGRDNMRGQLSISSEPLPPELGKAFNLTVSTKIFVPPASGLDDVRLAVAYAHETSAEAFAAVTSTTMHKEWGRR